MGVLLGVFAGVPVRWASPSFRASSPDAFCAHGCLSCGAKQSVTMATTQASDLRHCANEVLMEFDLIASLDSLLYVTINYFDCRPALWSIPAAQEPESFYNP